ncbi:MULTISPECIES: hypothetical protein [Bradyrhizobium]|uniref:hypothetical protein n=1 Tax=Bradyrhizobium TaxID=374 RepID=UPI00047FE8DD|nr:MULTISPECIES: hypothetical protein [Bradyrhizobium]UFW51386.1 hypothetical protein BaraCB756_10570 [Bradyrhizobium arachidis]
MISDLASALSANWTDHFSSASETGMMALYLVAFDAIMPAHSAGAQRIRPMASSIARALRLDE